MFTEVWSFLSFSAGSFGGNDEEMMGATEKGGGTSVMKLLI
jgi:hypothetical protein